MWRALLPADQWISVPRRSAMLVNGHYVQYPLVGRNLLTQMGLRSGMHGLSSLAWSRFRRRAHLVEGTASFRDWGTNEFGRYWYDMFFDGYVRKTWLTDPNEITSDWANQRIKPIGWRLDKERQFEDQDVFHYPRLGPGQLWEAAAAALADVGVVPSLDSRVVKVRFDGRHLGRRVPERRNCVRGRRVLQHAAAVAGGGLGTRAAEAHPDVRRGLKHRSLITVAVALPEALRHSLQLGVHTWQQLSGRPDSELRTVVARTLSRRLERHVPGARVLRFSGPGSVGGQRRKPGASLSNKIFVSSASVIPKSSMSWSPGPNTRTRSTTRLVTEALSEFVTSCVGTTRRCTRWDATACTTTTTRTMRC